MAVRLRMKQKWFFNYQARAQRVTSRQNFDSWFFYIILALYLGHNIYQQCQNKHEYFYVSKFVQWTRDKMN